MTIKKFEFKKTYEEVEIAGKVYKVDLQDESVKKYQKQFNSFTEQSMQLQEAAKENMTVDEQAAFLDQSKELAMVTINTLLGENAFDELYEASGKSLINVMDLINFLTEVIREKAGELQAQTVDKYLKK
jgi:hypothetical protein